MLRGDYVMKLDERKMILVGLVEYGMMKLEVVVKMRKMVEERHEVLTKLH